MKNEINKDYLKNQFKEMINILIDLIDYYDIKNQTFLLNIYERTFKLFDEINNHLEKPKDNSSNNKNNPKQFLEDTVSIKGMYYSCITSFNKKIILNNKTQSKMAEILIKNKKPKTFTKNSLTKTWYNLSIMIIKK